MKNDKVTIKIPRRIYMKIQHIVDGDSGSIPVVLWLRKGGASANGANRRLTVALSSTGTTSGPIGSLISVPVRLTGTPTEFTFNIPVARDVALSTGSAIVLAVTNVTAGNNRRRVRVFPYTSGGVSTVDLFAENRGEFLPEDV